ncbi:MAG: hypothetical protein H6739_22745 [Alphaproteobacteria bacterium]|nr:hypothetical protein [Alphaproteobacteria bacterium]
MFLTLALMLSSPAVAQEQPGWTLILPLGAPQFIQHRVPRGVVSGGIQVAGLGVAIGSGVAANRAAEAEDFEREGTMQIISIAGASAACGALFYSVMDAAHYNQLQREQMAAQARAWAVAALPHPAGG